MDPVAHTFTGAALAAAGLRRATPLATAALILGANAPDVDVFVYFAGEFEAIAFRRGWTHGVLAVALWPFVLTGVLLLWDRWVRRRRDSAAAPARAGPLLAVLGVAVVTHPTLDWLNDYGLRWLMPFDGTWFYGDALVVVDPWVWLGLGGVLFLRYSNGIFARVRWTVFWSFATLLVFASPAFVPLAARIVWVCGLTALVAARVLRFPDLRREAALDRTALAALGLFVVYMAATATASRAARVEVQEALASRGIGDVEQVMVAPAAANPFAGEVVAVTTDEYHFGHWSWLESPRLELAAERVPRPRGAVFDAAARAPEARDYLTWSRFPVIETEPTSARGTVVRFFDARYLGRGGLDGPTISLDSELRLLPADD